MYLLPHFSLNVSQHSCSFARTLVNARNISGRMYLASKELIESNCNFQFLRLICYAGCQSNIIAGNFLLIATGSREREGSHQAPNIWPRGMHNLLLQFFPACHAKFACFQKFLLPLSDFISLFGMYETFDYLDPGWSATINVRCSLGIN